MKKGKKEGGKGIKITASLFLLNLNWNYSLVYITIGQ
jgi:hypothetical protein